MRILHLESGKNSGGQEYRTLAEVQWLNAAGHQAWIACNPDSEIFSAALAARLPIIPLSMHATFSPCATWKLYQIIRKFNCHLIHIHSPIDAWIAVPLRLLRIPLVRSRHITNPVKTDFFRTFCYRYGCNHLIPTAEVIRKRFIDKNCIPQEHMTVIGEGVDISQFHPHVDGSSFRFLWGAEPGDLIFGCVGMLRPEKGQKIFIQAAALVHKEIPNTRFVIIGDHTQAKSTMRKKYRTLIQEKFGYDAWRPENPTLRLSQDTPILMHGHESDIAKCTAALHVAVIPSLEEAQSRTAPEACCLGKPIIASQIGGLPEIVQNEETGLLVPRGNIDALAAAMIRLARDSSLREKLATAAAKKGQAEFSLDARMKETLAVYAKILNNRTS